MEATNETTITETMERNKELVLRFYGTSEEGVRRDLLAPDMVGRAPGIPPFGRDGFLQGIAELTEAFPDGTYTNDDIIAEGDKVVTVGRFRGTHLKPFHGAPPTGKPVTFAAVHVDRLSNGRIVEHLRISTPDDPLPASRHARGASPKVGA